jgi:predicted cupin superfamily sugar epimerase
MHMNQHTVSRVFHLAFFQRNSHIDDRSGGLKTFHVHHAGRSLYTLIKPPTNSNELPTIKRVVMGTNIQAGEVLQLYVPGGWWKASEIPPEDVESVKRGEADPESVGCLITEVVVPGWTPDQHGFLTLGKVRKVINYSTVGVRH